MTKYLLILFHVLFLSTRSSSQTDTSFWFVAPDISAQMGQGPVVLHILTYDQPSIVFIRQPAVLGPAAINTSVAINANSVFTLNLTGYISTGVLESAPANTVSSNGIYVSAKENVSAYYTIGSGTNKEMISLKGRAALGTDFYAALPMSSVVRTHTVSDRGVGIDIVAASSGTTIVLITPRANCVGRSKNVTFAKFLTQGQTFSLLDTNTVSASELAGSIISSDQPICVTIKGSINSGTAICPSYFADQLTSSEQIGKDYVVMRGESTTDICYILAPQNATSFTVSTPTGSFSTLINSTETFSVSNTSSVTFIAADKPVYLFHLSGYGCKLSGAQLAPVYCAGSYSSAFVRLSGDSLNLNVWTRSGSQGSFTLVSNSSTLAISGSTFNVVPGTNGNLYAARIYFPASVIPVGSYNQLLNSSDLFGLTVHNGGFSGGSAYAHTSNFQSNTFVRANAASTATICANTQFTLNGTIGGGPNTGIWSLVNGYGSFLGSVTQFTSNVYKPSLLDTTNNSTAIAPANRFVKIVLRSTGICPNVPDTLRLQVKQPPIVAAGANSVICGNYPTIKLNGLVYGATDQGSWSILSPGTGSFIAGATSFTPLYQLTSADTTQPALRFLLTSTNNGGCNPETATVTVSINKPPVVSAGSAVPLTRCSNNSSLTLNGSITGTATSTGIWTTSGSGLFSPNNLALNATYFPGSNDITGSGVWLYLESTNNGLCLPVRDSVRLMFIEPSIVNAGSDVNTCANDPRAALSGLLTGTLTNSTSWLGGTGIFTPSNSALNATYTAAPAEIVAGFVTLTLVTNNNGICLGSEDVIRINFQQKPLANFDIGPVCNGQISQFADKSLNVGQAGAITDWIWSFGDNSSVSNNVNPQHLYAGAGQFSTRLVVGNSFGCFDTIVKPATVNALPTASMQITRDCSGSAQQINFTDRSSVSPPDNISASGHYWDFGGFGFSFAKDTSVVFPSDGLYTISHVVTSNNGCQAVITRTLEITPRPLARFIYLNNSAQGFGANVSFRDTSSYAEAWSWDFGNGEKSTVRHPVTTYKENGLFPVTLLITDKFGCPSTYSLEVKISTVISEIVKLVPNVITPNNDGKNDLWRLDFIEVFFPDAEIEIFNRWGDKIYRSVGYSNAWDGSFRGDPLPVGVYFYTINLKDGESPVIKGSVTLIK